MPTRPLIALALVFTLNTAALADVSFSSTTQVTGGTLVDAMKQMAAISKSLRDMLAPIGSTTMVHGNLKAVVDTNSTEIIDLDHETITRIDTAKKTYTVTTFADMRKAFATLPAQMQKAQDQLQQAQATAQAQPAAGKPSLTMTADVSVKDTGITKPVNGQSCQERVLTLSVHLTDPASPLASGTNPVTFTVTTDLWLAPEPAELQEVHDFDVRFGQKLMAGVDTSAMAAQWKSMQRHQPDFSMFFAGQPGAGQALEQMAKELSKIEGTRIMEITSVGGLAPAPPPGQAAAAPPTSVGSVAGQVASDTASQTAAGESGKMGVFGNALTNSALGAFHRKKAAPAPAAAAAPAAGAPAGMQNVVLMSTTQQMTGFSRAPIPLSTFQVPAGYKKVENSTAHM